MACTEAYLLCANNTYQSSIDRFDCRATTVIDEKRERLEKVQFFPSGMCPLPDPSTNGTKNIEPYDYTDEPLVVVAVVDMRAKLYYEVRASGDRNARGRWLLVQVLVAPPKQPTYQSRLA